MLNNIEVVSPRRKGMYKASGVIALLLGLIFLVGIVNIWFSLFQDNWLIKLFKLNAGFDSMNFDVLHGLNPLDIVILVLVAVMYLGLYIALRRTSKIWAVVAVVQPFLGIVLFIVTELAGRSAVMGAGIVISCVMLRSNIFRKTIAFVGILSSVLLFVGDFGTTANTGSSIIAILIGIGYILCVIWFFLVGQRLMHLGMLDETALRT